MRTATTLAGPRRCPYCGHRCHGRTCRYCTDLERAERAVWRSSLGPASVAAVTKNEPTQGFPETPGNSTRSLYDALCRCRWNGWLCLECWKLRFKYRVWRIFE